MNVQVPASHIRDAHIVTAQLRRLYIPDNILAIRVLVPNLHQGGGDSVHSLPVHVQTVPWVREFDDRVSFKGLLEEYAFDGDPQVDESKGWGHFFRCQLQLDGGEVASSS